MMGFVTETSSAAGSRTVTLTWTVPRDLATRIAPAVSAAGVTRRQWLAAAVEAWSRDVDDLEEAARERAGPGAGVALPRDVVQAITMNRAAGNRAVVQAWTAFMVLARWPVEVLAASLDVNVEQVRADDAAGRSMLTKGGDMREVSRLLPPVFDPPDDVAAPPSPGADSEDTTQVKAWISVPVKERYQRKRALLGWGSTQAGCVLLMEALHLP